MKGLIYVVLSLWVYSEGLKPVGDDRGAESLP